MTYNEWRETITQTLVDWSSTSGIPIYTDNRKIDDISTPVVKMDIVYGSTNNIGRDTSPVTTRNGNIALRICAPIGTGSAESYEIAEELEQLFNFKQWAPRVHTLEGEIVPTGNTDVYQLNLLIRFRIMI